MPFEGFDYSQINQDRQEARAELFTAIDYFVYTAVVDYMARGVTRESALRHAGEDFKKLVEDLTIPSQAVYNLISRG